MAEVAWIESNLPTGWVGRGERDLPLQESSPRAHIPMANEHFDFVVVGSGFGGSVAALRLVEKGYRVLVLEEGRRFADADFPRTNWQFWDFLWLPALRLRVRGAPAVAPA